MPRNLEFYILAIYFLMPLIPSHEFSRIDSVDVPQDSAQPSIEPPLIKSTRILMWIIFHLPIKQHFYLKPFRFHMIYLLEFNERVELLR